MNSWAREQNKKGSPLTSQRKLFPTFSSRARPTHPQLETSHRSSDPDGDSDLGGQALFHKMETGDPRKQANSWDSLVAKSDSSPKTSRGGLGAGGGGKILTSGKQAPLCSYPGKPDIFESPNKHESHGRAMGTGKDVIFRHS